MDVTRSVCSKGCLGSRHGCKAPASSERFQFSVKLFSPYVLDASLEITCRYRFNIFTSCIILPVCSWMCWHRWKWGNGCRCRRPHRPLGQCSGCGDTGGHVTQAFTQSTVSIWYTSRVASLILNTKPNMIGFVITPSCNACVITFIN